MGNLAAFDNSYIDPDHDRPRIETIAGAARNNNNNNPAQAWPTPTEDDYHIVGFNFSSGESLPHVRIHYRTLGTRRTDSRGRTTNAVLILHGTGGSSEQFLQDIFAGQLFNQGQLLDCSKYYIIIRDAIGHGKSSKPSDGLKGYFPKYGYKDMILADFALLTQGLRVNHLRLVMGTSMGGMHSWLWAGMFPDFVDAAMPLASLPDQIAGRNRMTRKMIMDAITSDPDYQRGNYTAQPKAGLTAALNVLTFMSSVPLLWQAEAPDPDAADAFLTTRIENGLATTDANDLLYAVRSSRDYDPRPLLGNITASLMAVNSADDQVNPPELGILEEGIRHVAKGKAVVIPISKATRGHGTHTWAALWKQYLQELLMKSGGEPE